MSHKFVKQGDTIRTNCVMDTKHKNTWHAGTNKPGDYGRLFTVEEICDTLRMYYYPHDAAKRFITSGAIMRGGAPGTYIMHKYQEAGATTDWGNYYATNHSPGPPIQTTASNKGPDGANLFIFHIPNHFTNLDLYHLFRNYGILLSVNIMVEKETGRSRGFGFVSYDCPGSAALAIKRLDGFVIGNKRLKVQHKQIRATDHSITSHQSSSYHPESRSEGNTNNNNTNNASSLSQWHNIPHSSSNTTTSAPSDDIKSDDGKSKDAVVLPDISK